jgi:hypothetical protein
MEGLDEVTTKWVMLLMFALAMSAALLWFGLQFVSKLGG